MNEHEQSTHGANGAARTDSTITTWALPLDQHGLLDFHSTFASIAIVPVDDGAPRMFAQTPGAEVPRVDIRAEDGTTHVRVGLEGERFRFWRDPGKLHLVLCVPADLRGHVRTGSGRIDAGRLRGCDLELGTDAGAIRAEDIAGNLTLRSKTGRIQALGISGAINAQSMAGALELYLEKLNPGLHSIKTHVGAIAIDLARGLAVRVDAAAHVGRAEVNVAPNVAAAAILEVRTHVGSIRVNEAPARDARAPYRSPTTEAAETAVEPEEADEVMRVVSLVVAGKITPKEAEDLLAAIEL